METPLVRVANFNIFLSTICQGLIDVDVTGLWGFFKQISWEPFTRSWAVFPTYIDHLLGTGNLPHRMNALKKIFVGGPDCLHRASKVTNLLESSFNISKVGCPA